MHYNLFRNFFRNCLKTLMSMNRKKFPFEKAYNFVKNP